MGNTGSNSLRIIQQDFQETERLLNRRQYNLSMVKARQTLEFMVRYLGDRACIVDSDLMDTINQLYEEHWISKGSQSNYHKIRIIGNRAVHDGDHNPESANQAYQLLSQEIQVFSQAYVNGKPRQPAPRKNTASAHSTGAHRRKKRKPPMAYYLIKLAIPLVLVVILIIVIWAFSKKDTKAPDPTTLAPTETMEQTLPPETRPPEPTTAEPEESSTASEVYKAAKNLNVRPDPSTNGTPLGTIKAGSTVEYVKEYDDSWSVIMYKGKEAYVSTQFLTTE